MIIRSQLDRIQPLSDWQNLPVMFRLKLVWYKEGFSLGRPLHIIQSRETAKTTVAVSRLGQSVIANPRLKPLSLPTKD